MIVNLSPKEQELLDHAAQGVAVAQTALQGAVRVLPEHEAVVSARARLAAACDTVLLLSGIDPAGAELDINAETGAVEIHAAGPDAPPTFRPEVVPAPTDANAPTEI